MKYVILLFSCSIYRDSKDVFQSVQVVMNKCYHLDKTFQCGKMEKATGKMDKVRGHVWIPSIPSTISGLVNQTEKG